MSSRQSLKLTTKWGRKFFIDLIKTGQLFKYREYQEWLFKDNFGRLYCRIFGHKTVFISDDNHAYCNMCLKDFGRSYDYNPKGSFKGKL